MNHRWLAVLWFTSCLAWPLELRAERLPLKPYTTADGLAHNNILRIVRDSGGFLWFCTAGGLARFDGYSFANFSVDRGLPHSVVNDLLETRDGRYWVATERGLVRLDPRGRPLFSTVVAHDAGDFALAVKVLREGADGTIWAGTDRGLFRLDGADGRVSLRAVDIHLPREYPEQRVIADVLEDAEGSLWIAAPSGLYRRRPDGRSDRYTRADGLPSDFLQDLLEDRAGRLWIGTRLGGFFRFQARPAGGRPLIDQAFTYLPEDEYGLQTSWVFQLFETSDRRLLLATARGLVEFSTDAARPQRFRNYTARNGLSDHNITAIAEDSGGNVWLGTSTAGAMKLTRSGFTSYNDLDGIASVNAIFEDRAGHVCFRGTSFDVRSSVFAHARRDLNRAPDPLIKPQLGCLDGQRVNWFKPSAVNDLGWVIERVTLQSRSGDWWVGTGEGLYRFPPSADFAQLATARPAAVYTVKDGLAGPQIYRLFEDSRGNIWISTTTPTASGLARWEPGSQRITSLAARPDLAALADDRPARSFAEDAAGSIWIGFDSELVRYKEGRFDIFDSDDGLPPGAISDIHPDRAGRIWFASSESGIVLVSNPGEDRPAFVSYTTAHGLSSNNTEVISEDRRGRIYLGGGRGLDRFDPASGVVKHFTTADGLPSGLFRTAFHDRAGVLWLGMTGGLARLHQAPEEVQPPPLVLISALRLRGVPQAISPLGERRLVYPAFGADENQMQIDFTGLNSPGEVLRYQYRLGGTDEDWSVLSEQRSVTYASLSPGQYTFAVRAMNSDGVVSSAPAEVIFAIMPPIWQRPYFIALLALACGALAYAAYRYRVARLLEIADMRTRIATDLHDDIGANLTRIALLTQVVGHGRHDDGPVSSIARIARESVDSMRDIVWAINPGRESLVDLTRRMRQHADEIFTLREIELHFSAPGPADNIKLGVDVRRDLLLIFKEAVSNVARHAGCRSVRIDLQHRRGRLTLTVSDDGTGFDTSIETDGQGLTSIRRRAARLQGQVAITSTSSGTTVSVNLPT